MAGVEESRAAGRAVVADDLTGAMDGGVQLLAVGAVTVEVSPGAGAAPLPAGAGAVVLNTQSRGGGAAAAARRVRTACARLRRAGRTVWFKKLDSTLRGNVGAELAAIHAALAPCTIVCAPALPAQGRTVVAGELRVRGRPLRDTPYRDEVAAGPSRDCGSAVVDIVRRQWPACRAVRLAAPADARELEAALRAAPDLVVADAAGDDHLRQLAAAGARARRAGRRLLWAGSAGLLRALAAPAPPAGSERSPVRPEADRRRELPAARPLLLVAGSRRALAHAQLRAALAAAPGHLALCLEPGARAASDRYWQVTGSGRSGAAHRAAALALAAGALGARAALFLWAAPPAAAAGGAGAVSAALADLAGDALQASAARPQALLLVGGDTACACLRRLGVGAVALAGEAEPYVPWGRVAGGPWAGTVVVTKAGGFGDSGTLRRICARLLRLGSSAAGQRARGLPAGSPGAL